MKAGVIRLFLAPLAAVAIATVFQVLWAASLLSNSIPLFPFFIAVVLSASLGGIRAGLLATAVSAVVVWRVTLVSTPALSPHQLPILGFFLIGGTIISVILEAFHRSRQRASAAIAQLEEIQRRLRDSEQTFRNLADSLPVLIWVADRGRNGSWFNRAWLEFAGRSLEQELGNGWQQSVHPDDLERCLKTFASHFARRAPFEMDYRLRRHDGHYRWILDCGRPDFNDDGSFRGYMGGCIDIHDRKENQARIERGLATERRAREEAERVGRLKDEFIATVSHELRTPLTAILGWVHLLRQDPGNVEPGPALETIERNARAQVRIIEDLLDMNRILSGRLRLEIQCVALVDVIEAALAAIEPTADSREIRLRRAFDAPVSLVHGDAVRLQQIIWNLLSNAVKFSPAGSEVKVTLSRVGPNLEVAVRDSGEGIDPDFLPHVFERFRQADATITRRHGGMGLGLSIVKQLTELHGGSIRVESPGIGLGATFVFSLPAAITGQETPPPPKAPTDLTETDGEFSDLSRPLAIPDLRGIDVLVVDDDADSRRVVTAILKDSGATVRTASSAGEALALLTKDPASVLVSDIGMPGEDGYQLIQCVRALPPQAGGDVPAVALSALARSEDRCRAIAAGFQMHLAKPVEPAELLTVIVSLAQRQLDLAGNHGRNPG